MRQRSAPIALMLAVSAALTASSGQLCLASGTLEPYARGLIELDKDHYDEAKKCFEQAVQANPKDAESYAQLARVYLRFNQDNLAYQAADKAIALNPNLPMPYTYRGYLRMLHRQYRAGIDDCTRAIQLSQLVVGHEFPSAFDLTNRAKAERILGLSQSADNDKRSRNALEVLDKAVNARERGQMSEAMKLADESLRLDSSMPATWFYRGVLYNNVREYWKAVSDFTHAIELAPNSPLGYYFRADAYEQLGEHAQAVDDYTKIIQLKPRIVAFRFVCETGRLREHFEGIDVQVVDLADVHYLRAQCRVEAGDLKGAVDDLTVVTRMDPTDRPAVAQRADLILAMGKSKSAISEYSKAVNLSPQDWQSYKRRAEAYERIGDPRNAILDYSHIISLNPKDAGAYLLRARLYDKLDMREKAIDDYSQIIGINPKDDDAYRCRGADYSTLKQYEKALADFSKAIAIDPKNGSAAYESRAKVYTAMGKADLAAKDQAEADRLNGERPVPLSAKTGWSGWRIVLQIAAAVLILIAAVAFLIALWRRK